MVFTNNLWQQACRECGYDFVRKGTEEYTIVKKVFDEMKDKNNKKINSPSLNLWKQCAEHLGYSNVIVKKGSRDYDEIRDLFNERKTKHRLKADGSCQSMTKHKHDLTLQSNP